MKYKILKPFVSSYIKLSIGTEVDWDKNETVALQNDIIITIEELIKQGFIEEVKEPSKPKWKVGDYVVNTCTNSFIKIFSVSESNNPRISEPVSPIKILFFLP
jgi:hypothetical protein